jgi:hypothetical protein
MVARVHLLKGLLGHYATDVGKRPGDYLGITQEMNPDVLRQLASHAVDIVDDRLGQMAYDNQFFPKIALQTAQTMLMAPGWLIGGVRTATGGITDLRRLVKPEGLVGPASKAGQAAGAPAGKMPRLTNRVTGFATLALVVSALNAVTQYLMTGESPKDKDFFFPKTGRRNADDSEERLQYPTYWMDHYKLSHEPVQTLIHKLNPTWEMLWELYHNADYYDTEIVNKDQGLKDQAADVAKYITKGYLPFSITNAQKLADKQAGIGRQAASAFGVNPAPVNISRSDFQKYVMEKTAGHAPKEPRSQEAAALGQTMHSIEDQLRQGLKPDMSNLTEKERKRATVAARNAVPANSFKSLTFEDKVHAFGLATSSEIARYHLVELLKATNPENSDVFMRMPLAKERICSTGARRCCSRPASGPDHAQLRPDVPRQQGRLGRFRRDRRRGDRREPGCAWTTARWRCTSDGRHARRRRRQQRR